MPACPPPDREPRIVTVDADDRPTGTMDKMTAHRLGALHRAFSVFVFDGADRLLLQRRARRKYHSAGLWSNTCCSHPGPGERPLDAAHRRLREEMGFDCPLDAVFGFVYRAPVDGGLVEHEYDHVIAGRFPGVPVPDAGEVDAWRWERISTVRARLATRPGEFTVWFRIALDRLLTHGGAPPYVPTLSCNHGGTS